MDAKLNDDEISALQSLDPADSSSGGVDVRDGDLPQRLFAFNLVTRQPSGTTILTKAGERALFRYGCISDLLALGRGNTPRLAASVERWLRSGGFIAGGSEKRALAITPRGRLWLDSLEADAVVDVPELTASDFADRRACSGA